MEILDYRESCVRPGLTHRLSLPPAGDGVGRRRRFLRLHQLLPGLRPQQLTPLTVLRQQGDGGDLHLPGPGPGARAEQLRLHRQRRGRGKARGHGRHKASAS